MKNFEKYLSALRESTVIFSADGNQPACVLTYESDVIQDIGLVIALGNRIVKSNDTPLFSIREEGRGTLHRRSLSKTSLGDMFTRVLRVEFSRFSQYYPCHTLHPVVSVVQSAIHDRVLSGFDVRRDLRFDTDLVYVVDRLNGCVSDLRKRLRTSAMRRETDDFTRNARKNCLSLKKYFDAILEVHGSAIVYRAELFFRKGNFWPSGTDQVGVDYKTARGYIDSLRETLDELPEHYLRGHVLRLDHSLERGYVVHAVLLANPLLPFLQPEGPIGFIGRKWSEITAGKGAHYEYGADIPFPQASFKRCGTGLCYANNPMNKQQLHDAALYLSMLDSFVRLNVPEQERALWRGITPKPAKKPHDVTAGAQILPTKPWVPSDTSGSTIWSLFG